MRRLVCEDSLYEIQHFIGTGDTLLCEPFSKVYTLPIAAQFGIFPSHVAFD